MNDQKSVFEANEARRLRSAAAMTDYQMQRAARDTAKKGGHAYLARFPDLREVLPWIRAAA